jgi:hypothetical protein
VGAVNDKCILWSWISQSNPDDVVNFINGTVGNKRVTDIKISAVNKTSIDEFYIFFQEDSSLPKQEGWSWKPATDPQDISNFLNGEGGYTKPVSDARICGFSKDSSNQFYIFYRYSNETTPIRWNWKIAADHADAMDFLNGDSGVRSHIREIVSIKKQDRINYHIFYKLMSHRRPQKTWSDVSVQNPDEVLTFLNRQGNYPSPVKDAKVITSYMDGTTMKFIVFTPPGFLIITRPLFVNSLSDYIQWKYEMGFDVYLITAEWIDYNIGPFVGNVDIRMKIRNCIFTYWYKDKGLKFALLIGDSDDFTFDMSVAPPPAPSLSKPWNLPSGCYQSTTPYYYAYTSLYWSDMNLNTEYTKTSDIILKGNFRVAVGIIPVQTTEDLENVLYKTMNAPCTMQATFVYSCDMYAGKIHSPILSELQALAAPAGITISSLVFGFVPSSEVYAALFEREGMILESGHGNISSFRIGSIDIVKADAQRFMNINPLFITSSCGVFLYNVGECIDEAFLKTMKGPAVVITGAPWGDNKPPNKALSVQEEGFWKDLFAGKSIGTAFYGNRNGTHFNPDYLFGDPSLVIFDKSEPVIISKSMIIDTVWATLAIVVGALLITPRGVFCIKCGVPFEVPGYIGDPAVTVLGLGLIVFGIYGFMTRVQEPARVVMHRLISKIREPARTVMQDQHR